MSRSALDHKNLVRTRHCFDIRTTSFYRYGCCMDVETMSCAYWERDILFCVKSYYCYCADINLIFNSLQHFLTKNCRPYQEKEHTIVTD